MNQDQTACQAQPIRLVVNGRARCGAAEPRVNLADFLRGELKLTGTHVGCEHGVCGACTVLVDGHTARSCLMLAVQAQDCRVDTIEGLADENGTPHPLQAAFHELHALQCGYCTPGILMSLAELLREQPDPDEAAVRDVLSGHLCRCTGYQNIVAAALDAARRLREGQGNGRID
jgi:aerobic-type carbon monoxide dehydrogenase small subunit (CoxS/CutS family)